MKYRVIGVSGLASSGKDAMFSLLNSINPKIKRFALADFLKEEIQPYIKSFFNIDILNCSREEKNLVRPLLVAHGKIRRTISNGTHWTSLLEPKIKEYLDLDPENIALITDIRYAEYHDDEHVWIYAIGGCLVHLTMILKNGKGLAALNQEEATNDPILRKMADLKIVWKQTIPFSLQNPKLIKAAEKVYEFIKC